MDSTTFDLDAPNFPAPFLERAAFLSPARPLRELWLLMSLGHDESLSQHRLARRVGLSPARVNEYLRELEERGWVAREGETNRTIRYRLTEAGRSARRDAFLAFCGEMVRLYGHTKLPFRAALSELAASGLKRLVLFGAAETCEMVSAAARGLPIEVAGVVDGDPARVGTWLGGHCVASPDSIPAFEPDAVLITSFGARHAIYESIRGLESRGIAVRQL
ncbi:MAG: winged helix-turn-helix transcriptional regulator [bacterium]